jgi:hypothetical protein
MTIRTIVILLFATISMVSSGRLVQAASTDKIEQKSFAKTLYETLWKAYRCHPDERWLSVYKGTSAGREILERNFDQLMIEVRCSRHHLESAYISFRHFKNIDELEPRDLVAMEFVYGSAYIPRPEEISPITRMKVISDHPFVKEVMEAVSEKYPGGCTKHEWTHRPWGNHGYEMIEAAYACRVVPGSGGSDSFSFSGKYFPDNDFVELNLVQFSQVVT